MSQSLKNPIRYAITGAAGFIGARLAAHWIQKRQIASYEVLLVDRISDFDSRACVLANNNLQFTAKMDSDQFLKDLLDARFPNLQAIFHMGACSRTDEMRWDYLERNNLQYSQNLWSHATKQGVDFYYASSAATYGTGDQGYSDSVSASQLYPLNPYGKSKQLFDLWVEAECRKGQHPPHWNGFKFFNVYGPFEFHKNSQASVVMHAFLQIRKTGKLRLFRSANPKYKDGEQMRDFIYIDDVCETVSRFANEELPSGIFNLGRGQAQSFLDLARAAAKTLGQELRIEWIDTPAQLRQHYQYFTEADTRRLREAGVPVSSFLDLEAGCALYWKEWQALERKGIALV